MDLHNFFVEFEYQNEFQLAEVKPCCQENNVYYYDVYIQNKYQFTITPSNSNDDDFLWKIALKNADKHVDPEFVELLGQQIEKHFFDTTI
jgi:hypothetical protein